MDPWSIDPLRGHGPGPPKYGPPICPNPKNTIASSATAVRSPAVDERTRYIRGFYIQLLCYV